MTKSPEPAAAESRPSLPAVHLRGSTFHGGKIRRAAYLIDSALEAINLRLNGKQVPAYLNFFIGEENTYFTNRFCPKPFTHFEITPSGDVYICCPAHLPKPVGNVKFMSHMEILNAPQARKIRESILDGSFKYCDPSKCIVIRTGGLVRKDRVGDENLKKYVDGGEDEIDLVHDLHLSFDPTCNLSCPSCRKKKIVARGTAAEFVERVTVEIVLPLLAGAKTVTMNGYGDVFTSRSCRRILEAVNREDYPELYMDILTNGVLFTRKEWAKYPNIHDMLRQVRVSIDAASEETYKVLRRGGDFSRLRRNLEFLLELRRQEVFPFFDIAFVYQKENLHEMVAFAEWGGEMNCDRVFFEPLLDWKTYDYDSYRERAVHLPENPLHGTFLEIIRDPVMKRDYIRLDTEAF